MPILTKLKARLNQIEWPPFEIFLKRGLWLDKICVIIMGVFTAFIWYLVKFHDAPPWWGPYFTAIFVFMLNWWLTLRLLLGPLLTSSSANDRQATR